MKLILASSSPRRSEILEMLNMSFVVMNSHVDEEKIQAEMLDKSPANLVCTLSKAKSQAVAKQIEEGFVLGADTVVELDKQIYGKPSNADEVRMMLKAFSNRTHQVLTGVTVTDASSGRSATSVAVTEVSFRRVEEFELIWYENNASYRDKAGGYAIQEHAALFITGINGCYYNVVGLPVQEILKLFKQLGVDWKEFLMNG